MNAMYTITSPANSPVNISQKKHFPTYSKIFFAVCCLRGTVPDTGGITQNELTACFLCLENESFL